MKPDAFDAAVERVVDTCMVIHMMEKRKSNWFTNHFMFGVFSHDDPMTVAEEIARDEMGRTRATSVVTRSPAKKKEPPKPKFDMKALRKRKRKH